VTDQGRIDLMNHSNQFEEVWKKWKSVPSSQLLSIEEGVALSKKGDGSITSLLFQLFQTLLQNPIYIFGIYYMVKVYGKSIYEWVYSIILNQNNSTSTSSTIDPALLELVPDDEF
jgi:hypothetical protein